MVELCAESNLTKVQVNGFYRIIMNENNDICISINGDFKEGYLKVPISSLEGYLNSNDILLKKVFTVLMKHLCQLKDGLTIDVHLQWLLPVNEKGIQHVKHVYTMIINPSLKPNYNLEVK